MPFSAPIDRFVAMTRRIAVRYSMVACCVLATVAITNAAAQEVASTSESRSPAESVDISRIPMSFVPNVGQAAPAIRFETEGLLGSLAFYRDGVVFRLPRHDATPKERQPASVMGVEFLHPSKSLRVEADKRRPAVVNFFIGNDPSKWNTGVPTYGAVIYRGIYSGIDLHYNGTEGRLKGTWVVAPGADPAQIAWRYSAVERPRINAAGDLVFDLSQEKGRQITELAPVAWQVVDGKKIPVPVRYVLEGNGLRFDIGRYDHERQLVIDPTVVFSTLLGGNGTDHGLDVQIDALGFVYLTGRTHSNPALGAGPGWPLQNAIFGYGGEVADAFVSKFDPTGSVLLFSTYIGGGDPVNFNDHTGDDWGLAIDLDSNNDVYITGFTEANNFPVTPNAIQPAKAGGLTDSFLCKVSTTGGGLLYSSYVGGSGAEFGWGLDVDSADLVYLTGYTTSVDFPTSVNSYQPAHGGVVDGYVMRLDLGAATGPTIDYSTLFGFGGVDEFFDIKVDDNGIISLCGTSTSLVNTEIVLNNGMLVPQPTNAGASDAIVVQMAMNNTGPSDLLYFTFWGGSSSETAMGIDTDINGYIHITGFTFSTDFPTVNPFAPHGLDADVFFTKIKPFGNGFSDVHYSTAAGTFGTDLGWDVKCDGIDAYYCGAVSLTAQQDAFIVRLSSAGFPIGADIFGGIWTDYAVGVDVNPTGVAVVGYSTCRNDQINNQNCTVTFPLTNAVQSFYGGGSGDAFVRLYMPWL